MICPHQGVCGGCALPLPYEEQLATKCQPFSALFPEHQPLLYHSPSSAFRARAEFRIYRTNTDELSYAMNRQGTREPIPIASCPITLPSIQAAMPKLLEALKDEPLLHHKLFGVEFLSGKSGEILITLLYHKRLDESWQERAEQLSKRLNAFLIGRAKGQKIVLDRAFITETLTPQGKSWHFRHYEGSFTQPNPYINEQMISWLLEQEVQDDLLELYCGAGNFTLPLSSKFRKILATEISKTSIQAAQENVLLNHRTNIHFARLNDQETLSALRGDRAFRRLEGIALDEFSFQTILIDPPRAGVGTAMIPLLQRFKQILYISCNPQTLKEDLEHLKESHAITSLALFDQFPYTHHLECIAKITKQKQK